MPDFKPLPKPVSVQKKPMRRPPDSQNPPVRIVQPKVVKEPYNRTRPGPENQQITGQEHQPLSESKPNSGPGPSHGSQISEAKLLNTRAFEKNHQRYESGRSKSKQPAAKSAIRKFASRAYRFVRKNRLVGLAAAAVLAVSMIALLIWSLSGHNALAVYLDEERIGYIEFSQEITGDVLMTEVVNRLQSDGNIRISVNEEIFIRPTNSAQRNILLFNDLIERLAAGFTFQIIGTAIEVNGNRIGVLRNQFDAEDVLRRLQMRYLRSNPADYHLIEFVEDVQLVPATVDEYDLDTIEQVLEQLERRVPFVEEYVVRPNDTLGGIALRHNTTLTQIYSDNPEFSPTRILQVGDTLRIRSYLPFISVRKVEAETTEEIIPIEIEYVYNHDEFESFTNTIQPGVEGLKQVSVLTTRINGILQETDQEIPPRIIREMVPTIIERGTLPPAGVDRR